MLREQGILRSTSDNPVMLPDKRVAPWMLYTWGVTMTTEGMRLVGECMLERLRTFEARQLAAHGYTSVPILTATMMMSEGHYTGLFVREKRKSYGSMRRIDGNLDRNQPVVVIDDSIASGRSVLTAIEALESEGVRVEGALGLVNFPHGGLQKLRALGYRAEVLFDIYDDIGMEQSSKFIPFYQRFTPAKWGTHRIEDGLHPATAARRIAEAYLRDREVPLPPHRFDREYDARGGVFVSFRQRGSDFRVGRDGYWHFEPTDADACRDVVLATVRTVSASRRAINEKTLPHLKINVSFFTALEKIPPARLNFWTHGIVVRSRQTPGKMGGALPNTQVFSDEVEQYRHARQTNGKIMQYEEHDIYRHGIDKCVEPGETWLPYGFPYERAKDWGRDAKIGETLTKRAVEFLKQCEKHGNAGKTRGKPVSDDLVPCAISMVAVTLYHHGIMGCSLAWEGSIDECLRRATEGAWADRRFSSKRAEVRAQHMTISVSLLWSQEVLGEVDSSKAAFKLRRGIDSVSVMQGPRRAVFLSLVPVYFNWSKEQTVRELMRKAGIAREPAVWATYQTNSWLRDGKTQHRMSFGFTDRTEVSHGPKQWPEDAALLGGYIQAHLMPDGLPAYSYWPVSGQRALQGSSARVIHALGALLRAGRQLGKEHWQDAGRRGLKLCLDHVKEHAQRPGAGICALPGRDISTMTDAILLYALSQDESLRLHEAATSLARGVRMLLQPDGRVSVRPRARGLDADHDYMPGVVLLALARWAHATGDHEFVGDVAPQLEWYRRRFRLNHPWGMVGWQAQAWAALHAVTRAQAHAEFVFEIADWALESQSEYHGAFLNELNPYGLGFHTGFLTEGMVASWRLAQELGESKRAARYRRSVEAALRFCQRLYLRDEDLFVVADPKLALGGVRGALSTSEIRIDYNSHCLEALLGALQVFTSRSHS